MSICRIITASTSQQPEHFCFLLQHVPTFVHKQSMLAAFLEGTWTMMPHERKGTSCNPSPDVRTSVHGFGDKTRAPLCLSDSQAGNTVTHSGRRERREPSPPANIGGAALQTWECIQQPKEQLVVMQEGQRKTIFPFMATPALLSATISPS